MRFLLCLFFALAAPVLCRGEGVTLALSPDWEPMAEAQKDQLLKEANRTGLRWIDGSMYSGGGGASMVAAPLEGAFNKEMYQSEVKKVLDGCASKGFVQLDRKAADVDTLHGMSAIFRLKGSQSAGYLLTYVLFTDHDLYLVNIVTLKDAASLKRTDPLVKSYLGRIQIDSSVVPVDVGEPGRYSLASLKDYQLGSFNGLDLAVLGTAIVLLALIAKFVPGR